MLNYNSVIKNEINQENISVKEITPVMKINLRGKKREFLSNVSLGFKKLSENIKWKTISALKSKEEILYQIKSEIHKLLKNK